MDIADETNLIKEDVRSFFARDYPLIKLFPYGDEILVYAAKPHLAFILSNEEMAVLIGYLSAKPLEEIIGIHSARFNSEQIRQLFAKYSELSGSGVFIRGPAAEISPVDPDAINEQLAYFAENIFLRKFCLGVTEDCNYRCTYCKRTIAKNYKQHSANYLSEENACRGIDYYFSKYTAFFQKLSPEKKALLLAILPPGVSWYGGEPFLNFELIKKSAAYFKSLPWEKHAIEVGNFRFSSNTNLSIMNNEILEFLVENKVRLFASLDGPAEEHDKCRLFESGKGTFATAYNNLLKIKEFDGAYFQERVTILGVYTDKHDHDKCVAFTRQLGASGCEHFPAEYAGTFVPNRDAARENMAAALERRFAAFKQTAATEAKKADSNIESFANLFPFAKINYDHPAGKNALHILLTCPMGFDNLMVAANGDFLICHKVDDSMPIGDAASGMDFEKLAALYQRYNSAINNNECKNCWIVNFCSVCAAARMARDHFANPEKPECDVFRQLAEYDFRCFIHLSRNHPELLEKIFAFRNDRKKFIGVIDINEF